MCVFKTIPYLKDMEGLLPIKETPASLPAPEAESTEDSEAADCQDATAGAPPSSETADLESVEGEDRRQQVPSTSAVRPDVKVSEQERARTNLLLGVSLLLIESRISIFEADSPIHSYYVFLTSLAIAFSFIVWHAGSRMSKSAEKGFLLISTVALYGAILILLAVSLHRSVLLS